MLELTIEQISMGQSAVDKPAALQLLANHLVADGLVADARSERIVGRCDGILSGALRHCGSNEAAGGQQAHERVPQRRRRSSAVHGSSRNRRQKRVLGAVSSHDGERS